VYEAGPRLSEIFARSPVGPFLLFLPPYVSPGPYTFRGFLGLPRSGVDPFLQISLSLLLFVVFFFEIPPENPLKFFLNSLETHAFALSPASVIPRSFFPGPTGVQMSEIPAYQFSNISSFKPLPRGFVLTLFALTFRGVFLPLMGHFPFVDDNLGTRLRCQRIPLFSSPHLGYTPLAVRPFSGGLQFHLFRILDLRGTFDRVSLSIRQTMNLSPI